jgi:hypothetical protein
MMQLGVIRETILGIKPVRPFFFRSLAKSPVSTALTRVFLMVFAATILEVFTKREMRRSWLVARSFLLLLSSGI